MAFRLLAAPLCVSLLGLTRGGAAPLTLAHWVLSGFVCAAIVSLGLAAIFLLGQRNLRLQKNIENIEGRLKAIFDNAPAEIYLKDKEGRYVMINPEFERLFGIKDADVVGLLPTDIHEEELGLKTRAHDLSVLQSRKTLVRDEVAQTERGMRTLNTIKFPTYDAMGELNGLGAIVTDVTEFRAAEQELRQAQKLDAVGQLAGGMAHDFNNLLAVVLGNLELHHMVDDAKEKEMCISNAIDASKRGADLIRDLLSFAKRSALSPENLKISDLAVELQKWSARLLPGNIGITITSPPDERLVFVDRSMLQAALLNILLNAKDAMPSGGAIRLEISNEDPRPDALGHGLPREQVFVTVSDTGDGMTEATLAQAFAPFFSTKPVGAGSGLGLSMVQGFMEQSGGTVQIQSRAGQGTEVYLAFPAQSRADGLAPSQARAQTIRARGRTGHILVVEDEIGVRDWLVRALQTMGHSVTSFDRGDAAYEAFAKDPGQFDLLVADIVLPGTLQGPSLANQARGIRGDLPVVFLSGYPKDSLENSLSVGALELFLTKPVEHSALSEAVGQALGAGRDRASITATGQTQQHPVNR